MKITKEQFYKALSSMVQSQVTYPMQKDKRVAQDWLINWFPTDAEDAVTFGVLKEPKFDGYSDIAIMQKEWYVEELLHDPFVNALKELNIEIICDAQNSLEIEASILAAPEVRIP